MNKNKEKIVDNIGIVLLIVSWMLCGFVLGMVISKIGVKNTSQYDMATIENWCGDGQTVQILSGYPVDAHNLLDDNGDIWYIEDELDQCLYLIWTNDNKDLIKLWKDVQF